MIKCPNCGSNWNTSEKFCGKCGTKLPEPKICPNCNYQSYKNEYCTKCGTKLISKEEYDKTSNKIESLLKQARHFLDNNELNDAIKCFDEILNISQNDAQIVLALTEKAKIYRGLGKYEKAIECYDKQIEIDSSDNFAFLFKGNMLSILGKYEEAIECYDKSILIDSEYHSPYMSKGFSLLELNKFDDAVKCFDKALRIENTPFNWHYIVGELIKFSQLEKAWDYCNRGLNLHRDNAILNSYKARLLCLTGNEIESKELISKYSIRESYLYYEVASYFNKIGEFHKALRYCAKSINLDSEHVPSLALMGVIYFNLKQNDLALNYFKKGLKLSSDKEKFANRFSKDCRDFIISNLFNDEND